MRPTQPENNFTRLSFYLILAVVFAIAGCAGNSRVDLRPTLTQETVTADDNGILVLRIVNAGSAPLPFNYITIVPSNLNASDKNEAIRLESIGGMVGDSSLFISSVPKGNYSVSDIRGFYSQGDRWYSRGVNTDVELGTFPVEAGKTTDLGVLIYYPKRKGDKRLDTLVRSPASSNRSLISEFTPFAKYSAGDALTWNDDGNDDERFTTYASIVRNPVVYNKRYIAPDNSVYFIGKLGYILQRTVSGEWLEDAVETDADLLAIDVSRAGDIAVGGELGTLFYKKAGAQEWLRLPVDKTLTVQELSFTAAEGLDFVVWDRIGITVQRISDLAFPEQRQMMATFEPSMGWRDAAGTALNPLKRERKGKISLGALYTQYINEKNYIFITDKLGSPKKYNPISPVARKQGYRYDPDTWSVTSFSHFGDGVDRLLDAGRVRLGIKEATYWSWYTQDQYLRYDAGNKKWVKLVTRMRRCVDPAGPVETCKYINGEFGPPLLNFKFIGIPVFFSDLEGVAFVKFESDRKEPDLAILTTHDGGLKWKEIASDLPGEFCANSIPEVKNVLLVSCNGISSDFYESKDQGKTWEHVRQSENY